jgi:hypothetical protein
MTNAECRRPKEARNPNPELPPVKLRRFGFRASDFFRNSDFGFALAPPACPAPSAESPGWPKKMSRQGRPKIAHRFNGG